MNNSSGDPVSLEFLIFFHFVFSITFSSQDCSSTVSVKQMLLLFPCSLLFFPTPPRENICGKGHGHPLQYECHKIRMRLCLSHWSLLPSFRAGEPAPSVSLYRKNLLVKKLIYAQIGQIAFPSSLNHYHTASEPDQL